MRNCQLTVLCLICILWCIHAHACMFSVSFHSRFGFITYTSPECVERCLAEGPHEIDDRIVETKRAVPREETRQEHEPSSKSKKVIANIHDYRIAGLFRVELIFV